MKDEFMNRYNIFCKCLKNLEKSRKADPEADFVREGTVQNFNLTFDIAWKVLKDILIKKMGILDFATGSPRETLQQAYMNKLIEDDQWIEMMKVRNQLAHDYDGSFATEQFQNIITVYYSLFEKMRDHVKKYYEQET